MRAHVAVALGLFAASACGSSAPSAETTTTVIPEPRATSASTIAAPSGEARRPARTIAEDAQLAEGRATFIGMIRPTKGGHDVRGVLFDAGVLTKALKASAGDAAGGADPEGYLGAKVRVTAELVRHASLAPDPGAPTVQGREGEWFEGRSVEAVELVAKPVVIEGTVDRSKGLFAIAGHLVSRDDLAWSLAPAGGEAGDRVRLWGQPRVVVCAPNMQCLIGGSLPMFDVGRAEKLP